MTDDIEDWLRNIGLDRYAETFTENDISVDVLPEISEEDLTDLGVSLGNRKRLLKAIREMGEAAEGAEQIAPASSEAERRQLTVMFCDLVGSTKLSVRMDPEALREVISKFQKRCDQVARSFGGNVARYMGDGLLIYFGYPRASEHDPESAIHAGLEIIKAVGKLDSGHDIVLQTRVGIATGEVVVGDLIGAGSSREQSVIGETPNLAARLQSLAEPDQVVVGDVTRKLVQGLFELRNLGRHALKGFDKEVGAWHVARESAIQSRFEAIHPVEELTPLVSRERETQRLMDRWAKTLAGSGQAVLVKGEAGIGKSRLVHMLREQLVPVPHILLRYFCAPHFQNTALFPMIRQLEIAAGFRRDDDGQTKLEKLESLIEQSNNDAAELGPFLAELLSVPTGDRYPELNLSPQRWLERTLQALELQLSGLSQSLPVLVIFEDLHWIDPTTLEFLKRTVDTIGDMPVLMVMTSRPNFESPWQDSEVVTTISLDRLDHEHSATLVSHVLAGKSLPHEVVDLIVEKTDGIPLFIEELAKMMVESGLLNEDDGRFVLAGPLPELALPNSLQDLLMARLDRLPAAKELAQIGASIGRQFSHKLLVAVSRLREERVSEGVQQLVAADILTRKGEPPDTTYIFKHALIQDSAYSSLLREKRQKLHSTIAVALEKHWPDIAEVRPETLAHHYTRAGDAQNAITFWHRAADHAAERAAHSDAIQHASQAIDLLDKLADDEQRVKSEIGLRVALGRNQEAVLGYAAPEVEQTFERARDLCETLDETTEQVPVLLGLCVFNLVRANCRVTKELAEQCVRLSEDAGQVDYLIESYAVLTFALCYLGELQESRVVAEKCLALYEARGGDVFMPITAQNPGVAVLSNHAIVLWQLGFPDESEKCIERAFALAEQLGHPINFVQILTHVAELRQLRGEVEEARDNALRSIEMAAEHGYDYWQLLSTMHLGIAKGVLGETMDALAMTNEALNHLGAAGADTNLTYFLCGVAEVQRVAGDADKGVVLLDQAIQQAARSGENFHIALLHIQRGECYLELAAPDENAAEADFVRAMKLARAQQAVMLELRAACRLYRLRAAKGGAEDVRSDLEALVEAIEGGANTTDVIEAKTLLSSSA